MRRSDDGSTTYTDWYGHELFLVTLIVFALSTVDATLTLMLLGSGTAVEANPVMRGFLELDTRLFVTVKCIVTGFGLVALVAYSNLLLFRRLSIVRVIDGLMLMYVCLIAYEITLFMRAG